MRRPGSIAATLAAGALGFLAPSGSAPASADRAPDPASAARSIAATFPELAQPPQAPAIPDGSRVVRYVTPEAVRVVDAQGRRSLILSSVPLRSSVGDGRLAPLSLDLQAAPGATLEPQNPAVALSIARDPRDGFTVGPDDAHSVTITPAGIDDQAAATTWAGQLLVAGSHAATDSLLRPSESGVQTFEQLKGPDAPEEFAYRLRLRAGQVATLTNGTLEIRDRDTLVVRALPALAADAARRDVPVAQTLDGDVLRLRIAHRGGGWTYPISLDPDFQSSYDYTRDGIGLEGWHAVFGTTPETANDPYGLSAYQAFVLNHDEPTEPGLRGFVIRPNITKPPPGNPPNVRFFRPLDDAKIFFNAPGTTHLRTVQYRGVSRFNDRDRQNLRLGLYPPPLPGATGIADDWFEPEVANNADVTLSADTLPPGTPNPFTSAVIWMFTVPCEPGDSPCPEPILSNTRSRLNVRSVQLTLTDEDFPTTTAGGALRDLAGRWTNSSEVLGLEISAHDDGSGVRTLAMTATDSAGTHVAFPPTDSGCDPTHNQTPDSNPPGQDNAICPADFPVQNASANTATLPEGKVTYAVDAVDLAGNTTFAGGTTTSFSLYLDRNKPATTITSDLYASAGRWLRPARKVPVTVTGTDTTGGQGNTSGVAHNHLRVTDSGGTTLSDQDADTCSPHPDPSAACDPGAASTFSVDPRTFPEGTNTLTATTTDLATNVGDPVVWKTRIDRTAPAAAASGQLLELTDEHTNATGDMSMTLRGRDASSGVRRLQLVADNTDGELVLDDVDVCPAEAKDPSDDSCPHTPTANVAVDPADLPDGQTTFVARAIDEAGIVSVDGQDFDTYIDHTPPDAPDNVDVQPTSSSSVTVTWPAVIDKPLGSGNVTYQYMIVVDGVPRGTFRDTGNPYATVEGLPPEAKIQMVVCSVDAARNRGGCTTGGARLPGAGNGPLLAVAASVDSDNMRLARDFRPYWLFDTSESFKPLNIESFFADSTVRWCRFAGSDSCHRVTSVHDAMKASLDVAASQRDKNHFDIPGEQGSEDNYTGDDSGVKRAVYVNVSVKGGYRLLDYWAFYRYNHAPYHDFFYDEHEGDWEGLTVALPQGATHPSTFSFVSFAEHANRFRYLPDVLRCDGGNGCDGHSSHINAYVADGTHATYPSPCRAVATGNSNALYQFHLCAQSAAHDIPAFGYQNLPEGGFDGRQPWRNNGRRDVVLPVPDALPDRFTGAFTNWPGNWNSETRIQVDSPGNQERYQQPLKFVCSDRTYFGNNRREPFEFGKCGPEFRAAAAPGAAPESGGCAPWSGSFVTISVCDAAKVDQALEDGTLERDRTFRVAAGGRPADAATGVTQVAGTALTPDEQATISGASGAGTQVFARVANGTTEAQVHFTLPSMTPSESVVLQPSSSAAGPTATLRTPSGTLQPDGSSAMALKVPVRLAPRVVRLRARRVPGGVRGVAITRRATHIRVSALDRRGRVLVARRYVVSRSRGAFRLSVSTQAVRLRVVAVGASGATSRARSVTVR
jgi:hypothetical protein